MFKIKNKKTDEVRWVYEIQHLEDSTIRFLTYDFEYNEWRYVRCCEWKPVETDALLQTPNEIRKSFGLKPIRTNLGPIYQYPKKCSSSNDAVIVCPECFGDNVQMYNNLEKMCTNLEKMCTECRCIDCGHSWEVVSNV